MRLLSIDELDEVFGGADSTSAITLPTTTVNATVGANPSLAWSVGAHGIVGYTSTENTNGPCTATYYKALTAIPGFSHLRCVANSTTHAGHNLSSGVELTIINDYAYVNGSDVASVVLKNSPGAPAGYGNQLDGLYSYSPTTYEVITLTASAFVGYNADINYIDPDNPGSGIQVAPGPFSVADWQAFVLAHEASHQTGVHDETQANGYGYYAVKQLRAGAAVGCP